MAINGYRLFDSDLHVIEPADLWQRYIDPRFRSRAPAGVVDRPERRWRRRLPGGRPLRRQGVARLRGRRAARLIGWRDRSDQPSHSDGHQIDEPGSTNRFRAFPDHGHGNFRLVRVSEKRHQHNEDEH